MAVLELFILAFIIVARTLVEINIFSGNFYNKTVNKNNIFTDLKNLAKLFTVV